MSTASTQPYMLDHAWEDESRRLELLEALHDPASMRRLEHAGVEAGFRCIEVGAGRGSIARWLGQRVGPTGSVLAVDLEIDLLADLDEPNVEVCRADVLELELPPGSVDLIHTRAVLTHIPERMAAIERMVAWLAPGGCLVLEEIAWGGSASGDPQWKAITDAYDRASPSMDWQCGRELLNELAAAGMRDIDADAEFDVIHGGTDTARWYALSMRALRDAVLEAGTATDAQIDEQLTRLEDPAFRAFGFVWVGAWGRRS